MDVLKRYTYFDIENCAVIPITKARYSTESRNWVQWVCLATPRTCGYCASQHGCILAPNDPSVIWPPVHERCRCRVISMVAFPAGTATENGENGVDRHLFLHDSLPKNYVTQYEAKLMGWRPWKGNLWEVLHGAVIGGDIYKNRDGRLPDAPGRVWYEADFDYQGGYRNMRRIVFSNDGLMFVTYNHYLTFSEVYWEGQYDYLYD